MKECLALVWVIKKLRLYLEGYKFQVITDHSALRWLQHLKKPRGWLARWALELQQWDLRIEHRKGAMHRVPDALSKLHRGRHGVQAETRPHIRPCDRRGRHLETGGTRGVRNRVL